MRKTFKVCSLLMVFALVAGGAPEAKEWGAQCKRDCKALTKNRKDRCVKRFKRKFKRCRTRRFCHRKPTACLKTKRSRIKRCQKQRAKHLARLMRRRVSCTKRGALFAKSSCRKMVPRARSMCERARILHAAKRCAAKYKRSLQFAERKFNRCTRRV